MFIEDFCTTDVKTISPKATIFDAAYLMREDHVGDLIVTEPKDFEGATIARYGKPVGILTDRDIIRYVVAIGANPNDVRVEDIMARSLKTAQDSDSVLQVISLMEKNAIRRIPVVNSSGYLVGIFTVDDAVGVLSRMMYQLSNISSAQISMETQTMATHERFFARY